MSIIYHNTVRKYIKKAIKDMDKTAEICYDDIAWRDKGDI